MWLDWLLTLTDKKQKKKKRNKRWIFNLPTCLALLLGSRLNVRLMLSSFSILAAVHKMCCTVTWTWPECYLDRLNIKATFTLWDCGAHAGMELLMVLSLVKFDETANPLPQWLTKSAISWITTCSPGHSSVGFSTHREGECKLHPPLLKDICPDVCVLHLWRDILWTVMWLFHKGTGH